MDIKPKTGAARPTLIDIARLAGVSKATVSLVLRNSPSIPERTRVRVMAAARDLGYVYNRSAANMRATHTRIIAMAVNDLTNPFFAEIAASIEDAVNAEGRIVLISNTGESLDRQAAFVDTVREYNVDGLILVPATGTDVGFIDHLRSIKLPTVLVSRVISGADIDLVHADNRGGMVQAMTHLIDLGHRRIGLIGLNEAISTGRDRLAGYRQALDDHALPFDAGLLMSGAPTRGVGMEQVQALLDLPDPPTATICFNDVVAFGAMLGLRARNLVPGQDFSVIGADDIAEAVLWQPALTTVQISRPSIGKAAVDLLLRRIADVERPSETVVLPAQLVVRDSTRPPRR